MRSRRARTLTPIGGALGVLAAAALMIPTSGANAIERRWDVEEKPYEEQGTPRKIATNLRDGSVNLLDSLGQGASTGFTFFSPRRGGLFFQKLATVSGDVVGLVDANPVTQHVTKGLFSRQLLRFGALAEPAPSQIALIYDTEFTSLRQLDDADYVGPEYFHSEAYTSPSVVFGLGGTLVSGALVRPAGGLVTLFGFRETGQEMDEWGVGLVERSLAVPFF